MKKLKDISINRTTITFVIGFVFALLFLQQCNRNASLKQKVDTITRDSERNLNNYIAARDTIRTVITKNGDLISEIGSYEFDISNLNQEQESLINKYKKVLDIKRAKKYGWVAKTSLNDGFDITYKSFLKKNK